jgi:hypothetical protein
LLKGGILNPILVGAALWLWLGALAFQLPIAALATALGQAQGAGLFAGIVLVGAVSTLFSPYGFVGARFADRAWIRRASVFLLTLAVVALVGAWFLRHNIRAGGGLPFIVLNVARRVVIRRAPPGG